MYRQLLVQGALASLLPTEDLQNSCLRILVTDIIADLILGRAIDDKLCEGWFLHQMVSKVVMVIASQTQPKITGAEMQADARSRLEQFGLLSAESEGEQYNSPKKHQSVFARWVWGSLQICYLAFVALRFITVGMIHARRRPARARLTSAPSSPTSRKPRSDLLAMSSSDQSDFILDYRIFAAVSTLLNLSRRMPWLVSFLSFWQHMLTIGIHRIRPPTSTLDR